jgi:hypothetical protein
VWSYFIVITTRGIKFWILPVFNIFIKVDINS